MTNNPSFSFANSLDLMIENSDVKKKSTYSTGETAKILSVSTTSISILCDKWEPNYPLNSQNGLESYLVGSHKKIPHHSILAWMESSLKYNNL